MTRTSGSGIRLAGSVELIPDADPLPRPGGGITEWRSLLDLGEKIQTLEERAGRSELTCSLLIDRLVELREALAPYCSSVPNEGVRLFMASEQLRKVEFNSADMG